MDNKLELRRLLYRQIGRLLAIENPPDIDAGRLISVQLAAAVADQAATQDEVAERINRRDHVECRQRHNSIDVATQDVSEGDGERSDPAFDKGGEGPINVIVAANIQDNNLLPGRGRCRKHIAVLRLDSPLIRIAGKICDRRRLRHQLAQQIEPLSFKVAAGVDYAGNVAARPVEAVDEPKLDWIGAKRENNRGRGCDTLRRDRGQGSARGNDYGGLAPKQIINHGGSCRRLPIRPAPINLHILSLDIARRLQAFSESFHTRRDLTNRMHAEEADQWRCPALRARR